MRDFSGQRGVHFFLAKTGLESVTEAFVGQNQSVK